MTNHRVVLEDGDTVEIVYPAPASTKPVQRTIRLITNEQGIIKRVYLNDFEVTPYMMRHAKVNIDMYGDGLPHVLLDLTGDVSVEKEVKE